MTKEFIAYLEFKNLSKTTQKAYCRNINLFLKWYKIEPINCTKKDILKYLEYLKAKKNQSNISRRNSLIAINHYYTFLLKNEEIVSNPTALLKIRGTHKKTLYNIYSSEELDNLYDRFYYNFIKDFSDNHIPKNQRQQSFLSRNRNFIMYGLLIYQGITTNEFNHIELTDLDTIKATIKIKGGIKSNPRTLNLKASQVGAILNYLENIRPQFFTYGEDTGKLFLALPECSKRKTENPNLKEITKGLTKQARTLDKNFINFKQIRASVITYWLKTEGLRKTQYLAGHRYISTTERYQPNNLDGLIENIAKYHPYL
ncbi:MAG: tyrosine-type recombinase/integrase [Chitinophagales bacterium]|jgi:site-specific recombinase XerD